jgi:O-antigen ligase
VIVPLKSLSGDPIKLVFGLGIGNVSHSQLGEGFTGHYYGTYEPFLLHQFAKFILELGLMGTILVLVLLWLVFRDSVVVAKKARNIKGVLALGWTGVTAIMTVGIFYKEYVPFDSMSFLFWYFAGLIAAERVRIARTGNPGPSEEKRGSGAHGSGVASRPMHTLS